MPYIAESLGGQGVGRGEGGWSGQRDEESGVRMVGRRRRRVSWKEVDEDRGRRWCEQRAGMGSGVGRWSSLGF